MSVDNGVMGQPATDLAVERRVLSIPTRVAMGLVIALGLLAGVLVGSQAGPPVYERVLSGIAFAVAFTAPVLLAFVLAGRCRALLAACGVALIPRIVLSFSPIFFPLFWPAIALIWSSVQEPRCRQHGILRHGLGGTLLFFLLLLPVIALFVTQ